MNMYLYIVSLDLINGLYPFILDIFSIISVFMGVLVITTKNPIVSVLFLISLFLVISTNLVVVGMHFIGLSYILVYVGAISILFLFILMLINIRISELLSYTGNSIPLALIFSIVIYNIIPNDNTGNLEIDLATSSKWDGNLISSSHISSIGNIMYTTYSPWLVLVAMILLLAMVGCIVITIKRNSSDISKEEISRNEIFTNLKKDLDNSMSMRTKIVRVSQFKSN